MWTFEAINNTILWSSEYLMVQTTVKTTKTCCTKSNVSIKVAAAFSKNAFVETLDLVASHQSVLSSALQQSSDKFNTGLKPVKSELVY